MTLYAEYAERPTHQQVEVCPRCKVHVVQECGGSMYCYHCGWRGEEGIYYALCQLS